jgi:SAM-dependent methyltransferase
MKNARVMSACHETSMIAESTRKVLDLIDDPAHAGEKTLRRVSGLFRYNAWLWEQIARFTGQRVLEVGAGIGTMTRFFLDRQLILATDVDARYLARLSHTFAICPNVIVRPLDLNERFADQLAQYRLDTVLCLNVLEHIEDDEAVLSEFSHLLPSDSRVVLIVPALQRLYGEIDKAIGHYRRYEKGEIMAKFERAGFRVEESRFLNLLGLPGWYLNSCLLKRKIVPGLQARFNDLLVPLLRLEKHFTLPWGMSLLAVGRKA